MLLGHPAGAGLAGESVRYVQFGLEPFQSPCLGGDDADAAARSLVQPVAVGDADLAARIPNEAGILEPTHRHGERRSLHADHLGEKLLGHPERRFVDSLVNLEEPARSSLVEPVHPIAQDQLGHGDHDYLGMTLEKPYEGASVRKLTLQDVRSHPHCAERYLHDRPERRLASAQKHGEAGHTFAPDHGRVHGFAALVDRHDRGDTVGWEVDEIDLLV